MEEKIIYFLNKINTINWNESDAQIKYNYQLTMMIDIIISKNRGFHFKKEKKEKNIPILKIKSNIIELDKETIFINKKNTNLPTIAKNIINTINSLKD